MTTPDVPAAEPSIGRLVSTGGPTISFEFFPPKDADGERILWQSIRELEELNPTFVSVTYGAGGATRDRTVAITGRIARETSMLPMAHLTCVGHTVEELTEILNDLTEAGVRNVLALRGDPATGPGTAWVPTPGGVQYASDLVALVKETTPASVGVAAFPEGHRDAASLEEDAKAMLLKQEAGAEFAVSDMVLRVSDYFGMVERAREVGVTMPIIPGIMPILNLNSMRKMVEFSGREMPQDVLERLAPFAEDPAALRAEGIAMATEMCRELLAGGAPGLHFYTLNRSRATREIWAALQLEG